MKSAKWTIYLFFIISPLISIAQLSTLTGTSSESFETASGWTKLKQLKNGNTILIEVLDDGQLVSSLFDNSRKCINRNEIQFLSLTNDLTRTTIYTIVEINSNLVLFISNEIKKSLTLYRVILDGKNGKLISDEIILEIPPEPVGSAWAKSHGNVIAPHFRISVDPKTEHYAILSFTAFAETNERIQVFHYNSNHKIINQSFYIIPEANYKYVNELEICVKGDEYIIVFSHIFNTRTSGGRKSKIYLSKLSVGQNTFNNRVIPISGFYKEIAAKAIYNENNKNLHVFMQLLEEKEGGSSYYSLGTFIIETDSLNLLTATGIPLNNAERLYHKYNPSTKYIGMPHHYSIDQNNNHWMLFQKTSVTIPNNGRPSTTLGDIGITCFDGNGNEKYGDVIRCNYNLIGSHYYLTYNYKFKEPVYPSFDINIKNYPDYWYFFIDVVSTKNYTYLFMNNRFSNTILPNTKKPKKTKALKDLVLTTYKYSLNGGLIEKIPLEKGVVNKSEESYYNPQASDYNDSFKTYATLLITKEKGDLDGSFITNKVIWYKLD